MATPTPEEPPDVPVNHEVSGDEAAIAIVHDYDWLSYLEAERLEAAPDAGFPHVEASLDSGVREGMIVERPLDNDDNQSPTVFWLASIDSVFGPLLKLSWLGDEDLLEIWHDLSKERLYPLGWCQMNKVKLEPPKRVAEMCPLWQTLALQYLEDATFDTISMHFIDGDGVTPVDRIKPGMGFSVQNAYNQRVTYQGKVLANAGGLLHIQDVGKPESEPEWIFYSSPRLSLPKSSSTDLKRPPSDLLIKDRSEDFKHQFKKNEHLEVILEGKARHGVVVSSQDHLLDLDVIDDNEDQDDNVKSVSLASFHMLAPLGTFLTGKNNAAAAPSSRFPKLGQAESLGFKVGQKLMALLPPKNEFHPCSILSVHDHFVRLKVDTISDEITVSVHDPVIFPISWCQTNELPFRIPKSILPNKEQSQQEEIKEDPDCRSSLNDEAAQAENDNGSWCPPVYFNYKCYSASFLSRARLAGLPQKVGPGPVQLVLRSVLNLIIGSSFKSGSVLRRLETKRDAPPKANFVIEELKGKSRVLNLKANIEIPTKADQVDKYLREVCQKLSACPNLVSTTIYDEVCPADCHNRPRTDFRENEEQAVMAKNEIKVPAKKRTERRKRRHADRLIVENSKAADNSSDESEASSSRPSSPNAIRKKRSCKEWGTILPKSEIRTRGAKLPNFSLHMKIRPSRKEQRELENASLRSSIGYADGLLSKSGAKKGRRELPPAFTMNDFPKPPPPIRNIRLNENPENWSPKDTARFLAQTSDCAHLAQFVVEEDIDGQAFMLLNYPTVKEFWKLKTSTAISLCRHIESVVLAHRSAYSNIF